MPAAGAKPDIKTSRSRGGRITGYHTEIPGDPRYLARHEGHKGEGSLPILSGDTNGIGFYSVSSRHGELCEYGDSTLKNRVSGQMLPLVRTSASLRPKNACLFFPVHPVCCGVLPFVPQSPLLLFFLRSLRHSIVFSSIPRDDPQDAKKQDDPDEIPGSAEDGNPADGWRDPVYPQHR
jgi:hypothetical protein